MIVTHDSLAIKQTTCNAVDDAYRDHKANSLHYKPSMSVQRMVEPRRASAGEFCRAASLPHAVGSKLQLAVAFFSVRIDVKTNCSTETRQKSQLFRCELEIAIPVVQEDPKGYSYLIT